MKFKKLNSRGFVHHFALLFVVIGVVAGGTLYIVKSSAQVANENYSPPTTTNTKPATTTATTSIRVAEASALAKAKAQGVTTYAGCTNSYYNRRFVDGKCSTTDCISGTYHATSQRCYVDTPSVKTQQAAAQAATVSPSGSAASPVRLTCGTGLASEMGYTCQQRNRNGVMGCLTNNRSGIPANRAFKVGTQYYISSSVLCRYTPQQGPTASQSAAASMPGGSPGTAISLGNCDNAKDNDVRCSDANGRGQCSSGVRRAVGTAFKAANGKYYKNSGSRAMCIGATASSTSSSSSTGIVVKSGSSTYRSTGSKITVSKPTTITVYSGSWKVCKKKLWESQCATLPSGTTNLCSFKIKPGGAGTIYTACNEKVNFERT